MSQVTRALSTLGLAFAVAVAGEFIVAREGKSNPVYLDLAGVPTACFGQTGPSIKMGDTYTDEECFEFLANDLTQRDASLKKLVAVPLEMHEQVAYLSIIYNIGIGNFQRSTMLRELNAGRRVQACNEIKRWVFVAGRDCRQRKNNCYGIVLRREQEWKMCNGLIPLAS